MKKIYLVLTIFIFPLFAQPVDDGDKASATNDDIFADVETIKNILMAYQAIKYVGDGKDAAVAVQEALRQGSDGLKDMVQGVSLSALKDKAWSAVFQYKHTKAGFLKMLFDYSGKLDAVLNKTQNKINEWNTTLPALKNMKDGMKRMADNTVEVMQEFKWSDLYDIDRKFDRRMNQQARRTTRTFNYYSSYLMERWNRVNADRMPPPDSVYGYYYGLLVPERNIADSMYNMALIEADDFTFLPEDILINCVEAITFNYEIMMYSQAQDYEIYAMIDSSLENTRRTMEDERQIQATIERYRHSLGVTITELEQILLALEQKYARLLLRKKERQAIENEKYHEAIESFLRMGI